MATIEYMAPIAIWEDVPLIDNSDRILGGKISSPKNLQGNVLANRDEYLYNKLSTAISSLNSDFQLSANGWYTFPSGLIIQWGSLPTESNGLHLVTFPKPNGFPHVCFTAVSSPDINSSNLGDDWISQVANITNTTMMVFAQYVGDDGNGPGANDRTTWIAIGY